MSELRKPSTRAELLRMIQKRTAGVAVGASTVRGTAPAGTAVKAREFLARLDLSKFSVTSRDRFVQVLDRTTLRLASSLPKGGRHWGLSRKLLNIFLRDCCYNRFLFREYSLYRIERWLELPLDSHVGERLREEMPEDVPRWSTIKSLTPEASERYQAAGAKLARARGIARVHLDLYMWRGRPRAEN